MQRQPLEKLAYPPAPSNAYLTSHGFPSSSPEVKCRGGCLISRNTGDSRKGVA